MSDFDPVVAAADRAEAQGWIHRQHAEAGAREALAPLRELHKPTSNVPPGVTMSPARLARLTYCAACGRGTHWPCATARLIYTTEELA